ncbi:MAG: LytTR family DNA-binding domain-containing protein [Oscillospiraceae bacterium]|nr:LytTR family DNA-binding domain-containing protein [Oscillospiraceae bacterium]
MWIGICEDNRAYRNRLEKDVRSVARPCDRVTAYSNGSDLLSDTDSAAFPMDVLLLDIEMPALSGIDTARELQKTSPFTQIVIVTSHSGYALQGYELRPSNYLMKPVSVNVLRAELERARRIAGRDIGGTLRVSSKDTAAFIPIRDILYIECFCHTLYIHTPDNTYKYNHTLKGVSEALSGKGFCRVNRSMLVNLRHVLCIDKTASSVLLVNNYTLSVSPLRISEVLEEYLRYRQSMIPAGAGPA